MENEQGKIIKVGHDWQSRRPGNLGLKEPSCTKKSQDWWHSGHFYSQVKVFQQEAFSGFFMASFCLSICEWPQSWVTGSVGALPPPVPSPYPWPCPLTTGMEASRESRQTVTIGAGHWGEGGGHSALDSGIVKNWSFWLIVNNWYGLVKPESMASDTRFLTSSKLERADLPRLRRAKWMNIMMSREGEDWTPLKGGRRTWRMYVFRCQGPIDLKSWKCDILEMTRFTWVIREADLGLS